MRTIRPNIETYEYHVRLTMTAASTEVAVEPSVSETAALAAAACVFRSLGDPARLAILRHLALGEHKVVDLTAHLGLAQSTATTP
jgi:DNA-binding transcriptional ArsR family regulator